jgi:hypothetical protein
MEANAILPAAQSQDSDPPTSIHLTWGQDNTAHTIVVTWKTSDAETGDLVLYSTQSRGGDPDLYENSSTGSHHTYPGARGYIHDVELTGLSDNTIYYFICGGENGGWSDERSFRTAPTASTNIRFVYGGDSRSGEPDWPEGRDNVSRAMAKFNPSFVIFNGDFVHEWNDQQEWDNWFAAASMYWIGNNGLTMSVIPCIGNHDVRIPDYDPQTDATNYYQQFNLPGNERWYALSWGPDLRIIVLDSEMTASSVAYQEQLDWLEDELKASEGYFWKMVVLHRDMISSRNPPLTGGLARDLTFLFDKYHVDLALTSHFHLYERSHPLDWSRAPGEIVPPGEGVVYLVSGGWGAPLYQSEPQWFLAFGPEARYHFVLIDVFENGMLNLKAVDVEGNVFDEYVLQKKVLGAAELPIVEISAVVVVATIGALYFLRWRKGRGRTRRSVSPR